jgi:hypothetical protein
MVLGQTKLSINGLIVVIRKVIVTILLASSSLEGSPCFLALCLDHSSCMGLLLLNRFSLLILCFVIMWNLETSRCAFA